MRSTLRFIVPLAFALAVTAAAMSVAYLGLQSAAAYYGPPDPSRVTHAVLIESDGSCASAQPGRQTAFCPALTGDAFRACPFVARQTRGRCPGLAAPQDVPDRVSCPFLERSAPSAPAQQLRRLPDQALVADVAAAARNTRPTDPV